MKIEKLILILRNRRQILKAVEQSQNDLQSQLFSGSLKIGRVKSKSRRLMARIQKLGKINRKEVEKRIGQRKLQETGEREETCQEGGNILLTKKEKDLLNQKLHQVKKVTARNPLKVQKLDLETIRMIRICSKS
jgi:hypothetical protein